MALLSGMSGIVALVLMPLFFLSCDAIQSSPLMDTLSIGNEGTCVSP